MYPMQFCFYRLLPSYQTNATILSKPFEMESISFFSCSCRITEGILTLCFDTDMYDDMDRNHTSLHCRFIKYYAK